MNEQGLVTCRETCLFGVNAAEGTCVTCAIRKKRKKEILPSRDGISEMVKK
jgi:hypothetical protein